MCEGACLCSCQLLNGATGQAFYKKVFNFQMDSHICTRFSGKVGHEPKDS